jgi:hypothetical protein
MDSLANSTVCIIVAPKLDVHAYAVAHAGQTLDAQFIILDTRDFPRALTLHTHISTERTGGTLYLPDGNTLDLSCVSSLWWRRPQAPNVADLVDPSFIDFAMREGQQALFGTFNALIPRIFNNPGLSRMASQKVGQLAAARAIGLTVPKTLITNDPYSVRDFYTHCNGKVIYKLFRSPDVGIYPTRLLTVADFNDMASLAACPCIFQEYIQGEFDVRATIVDQQCFAARLDYDKDSALVDTRLTFTATLPLNLPCELECKLITLVRRFGLVYGTIDLRFSPTDGFVFFELNPEGQYLWTEVEANLQISRAIALFMVSDRH